MGLSMGEDYEGVLSGSEGRKLIELIFSSKDWINRRVDSVRFPDGLTLHRQVSVDFLVPEQLPRVQLQRGTVFTLLPVALLRKEAVVNFSFWDNQRNPLHKVTRELGRSVMKTMLVEWAVALGSEYTDRREILADCADKVLREDYDEKFEESLKPWLKNARQWGFSDASTSRAHAFLVLARMLSRNFILFAAFEEPLQPGTRMLVKYRYDRPLDFYTGALHRRRTVPERLKYMTKRISGFEYTDLVINASNSSYARSYHFELTTPTDVGLTDAGLYDEAAQKEGVAPKRLAPDTTWAPHATRFGIYPLRSMPWGTRGRAFFRIKPFRTLWMWAVLFASLLISGILFFCYADTPGIESSDVMFSAAAIFLTAFLPTVLGPEEMSFARHLLMPTRFAASVVSAIPVFVAITAASNGKPSFFADNRAMTLGLALVAAGLALRQFIAFFSSVGPTGRIYSRHHRSSSQDIRGVELRTFSRLNEYRYEHKLLKDEKVQDTIKKAATWSGQANGVVYEITWTDP